MGLLAFATGASFGGLSGTSVAWNGILKQMPVRHAQEDKVYVLASRGGVVKGSSVAWNSGGSVLRRAQTDRAASEVDAGATTDDEASTQATQAPLKRAAVLRNFVLFAAYFVALLGVVGRATLEKALPHERIILVALAVILPDLARFSFVGMSFSPNALRKARNPDQIDAELFPRHYALCSLTTSMKLLGFYLASFVNVPLGAFVVILGQCIVNGFIQLRLVNGKLFQLRRKDRSGALLMELVMLVMLTCAAFNQFPIMMASLFLSMATAYWLGKYDCQLFA